MSSMSTLRAPRPYCLEFQLSLATLMMSTRNRFTILFLSMALVFVPASSALAQSSQFQSQIGAVASTDQVLVLPHKPSEMLRASQATWRPVLERATALVNERAKQAESLSRSVQIEINIQRAVLAQARNDWPAVLDGVKEARRLQDSESGRQTAGLLNELLARQAMAKGDSAWLKTQLRDQVLAMPWADVGSTIRTLRDQLAGASSEAIETMVARQMDVAAGITSNSGNLGFVLQLLGLRFQLQEVMPRRAALVVGLDEVLARHGTSQ